MTGEVPDETVAELRTGALMPRIGLGCFNAVGDIARDSVRDALRLGYRHLDTAFIYRNERQVGDGIRSSGVPRGDIFVTTKLWNDHQGYESALAAFDRSLSELQLDYVDLYLMHWPVADLRHDSWRAMERIFAEGRARAIGVSNFLPRHIDDLLAHCSEPPAVNQIEISPFLQRHDVRVLCDSHEIVVQAYSPLTKGQRLDHPVVRRIADSVARTPAQILLRWGLQSGVVVLPKSVRPERLAENLDLYSFSLGPAEMAELDALEEGLVTGWDPEDWP
jgi:diketogulonate reductase-like aldo/keto reductase